MLCSLGWNNKFWSLVQPLTYKDSLSAVQWRSRQLISFRLTKLGCVWSVQLSCAAQSVYNTCTRVLKQQRALLTLVLPRAMACNALGTLPPFTRPSTTYSSRWSISRRVNRIKCVCERHMWKGLPPASISRSARARTAHIIFTRRSPVAVGALCAFCVLFYFIRCANCVCGHLSLVVRTNLSDDRYHTLNPIQSQSEWWQCD